MRKSIRKKYIEEGKRQQLNLMIEKFQELHNEYYVQGDEAAANLVIDLVAYLQDDHEGMSD